MPDDYTRIFEARGDHYNEAGRIQPRARDVERRLLIRLLRVKPHHVICDAPAGGGYLADGLRPLVARASQIICVEPSRTFAAGIDPSFKAHVAPLDAMPIAEATLDRVGSLAGLHHLADKAPFFREAHRLLKPGGRFAVGDVLAGTPVARFLNGAVNRYSSTGHHGRFLRSGEASALLRTAGFTRIREEHHEYWWTFESDEQMVRYCQSLFGLTRATQRQVHAALKAAFAIQTGSHETRLPWSLLYAVGTKSKRSVATTGKKRTSMQRSKRTARAQPPQA